MNLERVSIQKGFLIYCKLSLSCKHVPNLKCRSGLKLNPDSCRLHFFCIPENLNSYYVHIWLSVFSIQVVPKKAEPLRN